MVCLIPWEYIGSHCACYYRQFQVEVRILYLQAFAASYWVDNGMPPVKISVGLPLYGRTFTLKDRKQTGIGAPTKDGGTAGRYTNEKGYLSFYEVSLFSFLVSIRQMLLVIRTVNLLTNNITWFPQGREIKEEENGQGIIFEIICFSSQSQVFFGRCFAKQ